MLGWAALITYINDETILISAAVPFLGTAAESASHDNSPWIEDLLSFEDDLTDDQRKHLARYTVDAITGFPNLADELDGETAFRFLY